ncbi:MAG: SMEK domain-containing protein [Bacteroidota bacterium]
MNEREINLKSISNEFAKWEVKITNLNSLNFYDANIISESTLCVLLNAIFDYKLINANSKTKNHAAIDLCDDTNRISYQITSTKSSQKIQKSLDTFFEKGMHKLYDELFVLILGKKQKKYPLFKCQHKFLFESHRHILDFRDLLYLISFLPSSKIKKINKILLNENSEQKTSTIKNKSSRVRRNLTLKRKMKKELLLNLDQKYWRRAMFEPYRRFRYHNIIVRSVENDTFPDDPRSLGKISNWFKGEFWDFYDRGLELISMGGDAIFDKNGNWDILNWEDDLRRLNKEYKVISYANFLRIPYDFIVELDMETDPYYALPALYVEYAKDGMPYEEILYGVAGNFEEERFTNYFDNKMRRKLV